MMVEVLLFAGLRELLETNRVSIEVPDGSTFGELRERLRQEQPRIAPLLDFCRFAQEKEMVAEIERVDPTRKIALIPPVSGG